MKCYSYITNNSKMIGLKELIFMLPRLWRLYPLWLERIGLELRHSLTSTCSLQRLEMYLITGIIDFERAYHRIIKPSPRHPPNHHPPNHHPPTPRLPSNHRHPPPHHWHHPPKHPHRLSDARRLRQSNA